MYPEPLSFIGIHFVRSYGIMLAISFFFGVWWSLNRAKRAGIDQNLIVDLAFVVLVASLVGSRFFYVIYHTEEFSDNLLNIINPFQSGYVGIAGLSMMGGVVLAIVSAFGFFYFKRKSPWSVFDVMIPMFALGIGITRIGCFLNGCCFGLPSHGSCGVVFPPESLAGYMNPGVPLIPTQLFEAVAGVVILALVLWSERFKRFDGHSFWITVGLYSIWRFIIDFYRYYEPSMVATNIGGQNFSRNQALSLIMFIASIAAYFIMYARRSKRIGNDAKPGTA